MQLYVPRISSKFHRRIIYHYFQINNIARKITYYKYNDIRLYHQIFFLIYFISEIYIYIISLIEHLHEIYRFIHYVSIGQYCDAKCCIVSQFSGQRTLGLSPARCQRSARKVKRAINCPLTRLIDRNKLRSIYIFLKNSNLSANDFITFGPQKIARCTERSL